MYKPCDFCSKDVRYCDCLGTCDFIPKYNTAEESICKAGLKCDTVYFTVKLCPICKELTAVYEPRCHKCGYPFILNRKYEKSESEDK